MPLLNPERQKCLYITSPPVIPGTRHILNVPYSWPLIIIIITTCNCAAASSFLLFLDCLHQPEFCLYTIFIHLYIMMIVCHAHLLQNFEKLVAWVGCSLTFPSMSCSLPKTNNALGNENNWWWRRLAYTALSIVVVLCVSFVCFHSYQSQSQHYPDALGVLSLPFVICNCRCERDDILHNLSDTIYVSMLSVSTEYIYIYIYIYIPTTVHPNHRGNHFFSR